MNLFDRISGKSINSDSLEQILSGRYLLTDNFQMNNHTLMKRDDILLSDGTGFIIIDNHNIICQDMIDSKD